eukprot:g13817.t2
MSIGAEPGGSAPQPTGDTTTPASSGEDNGEGPANAPGDSLPRTAAQGAGDSDTGPSSDDAGGAASDAEEDNNKNNNIVGVDQPNLDFDSEERSEKTGEDRPDRDRDLDGAKAAVSAGGSAPTGQRDRQSKKPKEGQAEGPKVPVRSASMGPQSSKGMAAAGGTRQGRWGLKNQMKCGFCGGKLCLRCSEQCALRCKGAAVNGLHSHWITESIIGMQRPSSRLIKAYDVVGQFKRKGLTAIFNLTEPGEHPHCGDGLEKTSGFPYLPETFMREGISVYNFAWEDMTTPSMSLLTDIVRVAVSSLRKGGKIAVHCHAGYGRTGLVIASILVMMRNMPAQKAVTLVAMVVEFANFVRGVRVVYHFTDHARVTLGQHLRQQAFLLHGQESVNLRWLPKPVALAARMLVALARENPAAVVLALAGVETGSNSIGVEEADTKKHEGLPVWGMAEEQRLKAMQYASNANDWEQWEQLVEQCDARPAPVDPRIPAQLLYDWLEQLAAPPINVTELRRALPLGAISASSPQEDEEATFKTDTTFAVAHVAPEGPFSRINLLPVGQVRLMQCLTGCLRSVSKALGTAGILGGAAFQKGCLRVGIALVHLDKVHEGLLVGRNIAPDAIQVLVNEWRAPLRCRPYSKLEALSNQPEVHGGNEEYWHQKRRSVVPPKDLVQGGRTGDSESGEHTSTQHTTGHTISVCTVNSTDTFSSWAAQDDTAIVKARTEASISTAATKRESLRRRSVSSGNVKQGMENVAPFDVLRPLHGDNRQTDPDPAGA